MQAYLDLLRHIREHGIRKPQRAKINGGTQDIDTLGIFGAQVRFDLNAGFPLMTTKRVPFRAVTQELLWFLSGSTNNDDLRARNVSIWDEWANENGELGPIYGQQWRRWKTPDGEIVDQIARLIAGIREVAANPRSSIGRRLLLTAWNPADMPNPKWSAPMACHTMSQYSVTHGRLSCQLYQRSADMFLGVPFNIACYALLTHLLAKITGLGVGDYIHTFGDAHIYMNHLDSVDTQLTRTPKPLPKLILDDRITDIDHIDAAWIRVEGYTPDSSLAGDVAV